MNTYFNKLPNDTIIEIALNLNITDIDNYCNTDDRFKKVICQNNNFLIEESSLISDFI